MLVRWPVDHGATTSGSPMTTSAGSSSSTSATSSRTTRRPFRRTNFIAGLLQGFALAKPGDKSMTIDFAAEYMSVLISHEFGHLTTTPPQV